MDYFKCAFAYEDEHFIDRPVALICGHCACYSCIQQFKLNNAFSQVQCIVCEKLIPLDANYCESMLLQTLIESNHQLLLTELQSQYDETLRKYKSK